MIAREELDLLEPRIDHLETYAEAVVREVGWLMEHARGLIRRIQDVDAEIEAGDGGKRALRARLMYEVRGVSRQLMRAQWILVPEPDERHAAAVKALHWLDDADREDRPWRAAA